MVILTQCCNDEEKARILDQARKVADERQQVDVNLSPVEGQFPLQSQIGIPIQGQERYP